MTKVTRKIEKLWGSEMAEEVDRLLDDPRLMIVFVSRKARRMMGYRKDRQAVRDGLIVNPNMQGEAVAFVLEHNGGTQIKVSTFDEEASEWIMALDPEDRTWLLPPGHQDP